jgi:hypothetical protein
VYRAAERSLPGDVHMWDQDVRQTALHCSRASGTANLYPSSSGDATTTERPRLEVAGVNTSRPGGVRRVSSPPSSGTLKMLHLRVTRGKVYGLPC